MAEIIINGVNVIDCDYILQLENGVYECIAGTKQCLKYRVCECNHNCYYKQRKRAEQKLDKIKDYCKKNKVAGWVDIEGIIEIIEDKENE